MDREIRLKKAIKELKCLLFRIDIDKCKCSVKNCLVNIVCKEPIHKCICFESCVIRTFLFIKCLAVMHKCICIKGYSFQCIKSCHYCICDNDKINCRVHSSIKI